MTGRSSVSHEAPAREGKPVPARSALLRFLPLAVVAAGLALGYVMGWHHYLSLSFLTESQEKLKTLVDAHYLPALAGFAALYALAVAFSFPAASVLTVFGGFLFGCMAATIAVACSATLGATMVFLAARSAFGNVLHERLGPRVARLADGFEKDAFGYLLVLRLAPVLPFWLVNIAPALFSVPLRTYVAATFIGILPGVVAYSYLGQGLDGIFAAARAAGRVPTVGDLVSLELTLALLGLALVAALAIVVRMVGRRSGLTDRHGANP